MCAIWWLCPQMCKWTYCIIGVEFNGKQKERAKTQNPFIIDKEIDLKKKSIVVKELVSSRNITNCSHT